MERLSESTSQQILDKFQCLSIGDNCEVAAQERVYSIDRIAPDPYTESWKGEPEICEKSNLMQAVSTQFNKPEAYDVTIQIGDDSLHVLMVVLQCYSKFFQSRSTEEKVIRLTEMIPEVFLKIYNWMLSPLKPIERDGLIPLLMGAQSLQVRLLEQQIWNLIQDGSKFQENEAFLLYLEAKLWKCDKVKAMMMHRVQRIFMTVVSCEEFLTMEPQEIKNWLTLDSIGINAEVEVFYAVSRWLLHAWTERKKHLMELMMVVRFGLIPPWRIVEFRMKKPGTLKDILDDPALQQMLESSLSYSIYRNSFSDDSSEQFADFLSRFGFQRLYSRDLMIDPLWQTHFKDSAYTYEHFEAYLNMIRANALTNWTKTMIVR